MRIVVVFILLGFMQSALAITKCELKGKTLYKKGECPENSVSRYLVKDEFVEQGQLLRYQQEHSQKSEEGFKRQSTPEKNPEESEEWLESEALQSKPAQMQMSNESSHFQLQKRGQLQKKKKIDDGLNDKIEEVQRKLDEQNRKLKQLQAK